jgi:hypothetical protein
VSAQDAAERERDPIEIDPNPCEHCGRLIDEHECRDLGEGPEWFCYPDDRTADDDGPCPTCGTMQIADRELHEWTNRWVKRAEDRRNIIPLPACRQGYRTAQSLVAEFFLMVRLGDAEKLRAWLRDHPRDAAFLLKLWRDKDAR